MCCATKARQKDYDYQFYLSAQNTEDHAKSLLALEQGNINEQQKSITVKIEQASLPPGTYQFQALMFVADASHQSAQQYKHASVSRVYQVY